MTNHTIHIAFLGPEGSYSHIALQQYVNVHHSDKHIVECSCTSFKEIIKRITNKQVKYGILPIENSSSGSIYEVYYLLQNTQLFLIGEINIPIKHCILTIPNTSLKKIQTIYSHPQPFQQCSQFLKNFPNWNVTYCDSSSAAMEQISKLKKTHLAALGNQITGEKLYGLQVIKSNLANKKHNTTRFIILGNQNITIHKNIPAKTTFSLSTKCQSDTFSRVSLILHKYNITTYQIKIIQIKKNTTTKTLFIDIDDHLYNQNIQNVLHKLENIASPIKILGCYPKDTKKIIFK